MRIAKLWLSGIFLVAAVAGSGMLLGAPSFSRTERERAAEPKDHWRHHDGSLELLA
jgi:hypothetical protein